MEILTKRNSDDFNLRIKLYLKIGLGSFIAFSVLPLFLLLIHELSHGLMANLVGDTFTGITFEWQTFYFLARTQITYINSRITYKFIAPAGSIGSEIFSLIILCIGLKKKSLILFGGSTIYTNTELVYWALNFPGTDSDRFYKCLGFENPMFISLIFWLLLILMLIFTVRKFYEFSKRNILNYKNYGLI